MGRRPAGRIDVDTLRDGTRTFRLRFTARGLRERVTLHEKRDCDCGCGGGWTDRTAAVELENILAKVQAGIWRKREPPPPTQTAVRIPTFHKYASDWLQAKIEGTIGDRPISPNTEADYRWRLSNHLLPFFARYYLDEIDAQLCQEFKAAKLRESAELSKAIKGGARVRERSGRRARPLGPASIYKLISCLVAILDEAVEDGHLARNPARGKRMRVKVPKPPRTFLEMDELVALMDAADEQDTPVVRISRPPNASSEATVQKVADRLVTGMRSSEIARDLGLSMATVGYHIKRLGVEGRRDYAGKRAVIATLGGAGLRASELCDLRMRDVRLHDPHGARLRVQDAKTEAGIREVQLSPDLVEELVSHLDRLRRAVRPMGPDAFMFPNRRGGQMTRQRVSRIVGRAAARATERFCKRGLPPLPNTTPHSLRRTYVSIALLANNFDVMWVMRQVGHADSKMTMDVYAQLQQRVQRDHGKAFDSLVRQARERLYGAPDSSPQDADVPAVEPLEDTVDKWRQEAERG